MPKLLPGDLLDQVAAALAEHPEGLALADLEDMFGNVASRRSLQRRLETWVRDEKIRTEGRRRSLRYFNNAAKSPATLTPTTGQVAALIRGDSPAQPPYLLSFELFDRQAGLAR